MCGTKFTRKVHQANTCVKLNSTNKNPTRVVFLGLFAGGANPQGGPEYDFYIKFSKKRNDIRSTKNR